MKKYVFSNIGKKIKLIAMVNLIIGILFSVIVGFGNIFDELVAAGIFFMFFGLFLCWISSLLLYGFGELIDNVSMISKIMSGNNSMYLSQTSLDNLKNDVCKNKVVESCSDFLESKFSDDTSLIIKNKNSYVYLSYWILAIVSMFVSGIVAIVACTMD